MGSSSSKGKAAAHGASNAIFANGPANSYDSSFLMAAVIVAGFSLVLSYAYGRSFSLGQAFFSDPFGAPGAIFAAVFVYLNARAWRICLAYVFDQTGRKDKSSTVRRVKIGLAVFAKISTLGILTAFLFLLPRSEFISFIIGFTATLLIGIVLVVLQTKKLG